MKHPLQTYLLQGRQLRCTKYVIFKGRHSIVYTITSVYLKPTVLLKCKFKKRNFIDKYLISFFYIIEVLFLFYWLIMKNNHFLIYIFKYGDIEICRLHTEYNITILRKVRLIIHARKPKPNNYLTSTLTRWNRCDVDGINYLILIVGWLTQPSLQIGLGRWNLACC